MEEARRTMVQRLRRHAQTVAIALGRGRRIRAAGAVAQLCAKSRSGMEGPRGVAVFATPPADVQSAIALADQAMYQVKRTGKGRVTDIQPETQLRSAS